MATPDIIDDPVGYWQAQVRAWAAAIEKLQGGQEYTIGGVRNGRTLKRADLPEAINALNYAKQQLASAQRGGGFRSFKAVPDV